MRIDEINNTDPTSLLDTIAKDIVDGKRIDCHGTCAAAIRDGAVEDNDIVAILGHQPEGTRAGKYGLHSVILSPEGHIKVDSYADKMIEYHMEDGLFIYDSGNGKRMPLVIKRTAKVKDLKQNS